jgi:hypothetical protein
MVRAGPFLRRVLLTHLIYLRDIYLRDVWIPQRDTAHYPIVGYATMADGYTLCVVQRLFSTFPPGWPGVGLLFLRSSVAIALLFESVNARPGALRTRRLAQPRATGPAQAAAVTPPGGWLDPIVSGEGR